MEADAGLQNNATGKITMGRMNLRWMKCFVAEDRCSRSIPVA